MLKINTNKDAAQCSGYGHYEIVVFGSNPPVGKSKVLKPSGWWAL